MTAVADVGVVRSYWELCKPRLSALAVFAVVAGAFILKSELVRGQLADGCVGD